MPDANTDGFKIKREMSFGTIVIVATMAAGMFANWKSLSIGMIEAQKDVAALEGRMHDTESRIRELEEGRTETRVTLTSIQATLAEIKVDLRKVPTK